MVQAKYGDKVKVHYIGKLEDGKVFNSTENSSPLEFTLGSDAVLEGFEQAIIGMSAGESRVIRLSAAQAYGEYNNKMVVEIEKEDFFEHIEPEVGLKLAIDACDGEAIPVTIRDINGSKVVIDANHPLVGKDLIFEIKLVEVIEDQFSKL